MANIYLIGSLRNPRIPEIGQILRNDGHDVYDSWWAAGPEADDCWKAYEQQRGKSYLEALCGWAATHTFQNDLYHLKQCDTGVIVMPAGKSAHIEIGWLLGQGKRGYFLYTEEPERWDVMTKFATDVCFGVGELLEVLHEPL